MTAVNCLRCHFAVSSNTDNRSIAYDPSKYTAYVAWEDGTIKANTWVPAACNTYINLNLQKWFYPY